MSSLEVEQAAAAAAAAAAVATGANLLPSTSAATEQYLVQPHHFLLHRQSQDKQGSSQSYYGSSLSVSASGPSQLSPVKKRIKENTPPNHSSSSKSRSKHHYQPIIIDDNSPSPSYNGGSLGPLGQTRATSSISVITINSDSEDEKRPKDFCMKQDSSPERGDVKKAISPTLDMHPKTSRAPCRMPPKKHHKMLHALDSKPVLQVKKEHRHVSVNV